MVGGLVGRLGRLLARVRHAGAVRVRRGLRLFLLLCATFMTAAAVLFTGILCRIVTWQGQRHPPTTRGSRAVLILLYSPR